MAAAPLALVLAWHRWLTPLAEDAHRPGLPDPGWLAVLVALGFALLQLCPLPRGTIGLLVPATAELYALDEGTLSSERWRPLSLVPVRTLRSVALGLAYLTVLWAARALAVHPVRARSLALVAAGLGALTTLRALAGLADGDPGAWGQRPRAPFVNPNHLCTYLGMAACLALGVVTGSGRDLALPGRPWQRRWWETLASRVRGGALPLRALAGLAVAFCVLGCVLTQSRAGLVAAGLGALTTLVVARRLGGGGLVASACGVLALTVGIVVADPDPLQERLAATGLDSLGGRLENWSVALRVIAGHPWAGSGLATFPDASVAALTAARRGNTVPGQAHNDYLELVCDLGLVAGLLVLALLGAACWRAVRRVLAVERRERATYAGALGAVVVALAHALFDFALQIPAPALLALIALGLSSNPPPAATPPLAPGHGLRRSLAPLALGAVLLVGGALLILQTRAEDDARRRFERLQARGLEPGLKRELARRAALDLEAASSAWGDPEIDFLAGQAWGESQEQGWSQQAERAFRRGVAGAPGRAEHQAGLAGQLLEQWQQNPDPDLRAEGQRRLNLALSLAPTVPSILITAGWWELERYLASGEEERIEEAVRCFRQALAREPSRRQEIEGLIALRAPALGAVAERVHSELAER